jgi:hypothetical protein
MLQKIHWTLYFLVWTAGISAVGALLGLICFPLLGAALGWKFTAGQLAMNGARNLGFLFFVWAVPIAGIACAARGYKRRKSE